MNTPITTRAAARATMCLCSRHPCSPSFSRAAMENGIAMPTMNRNAGKTTSAKLIASASAGMCLSQGDTPATPATSLTKIIATKVRPRNASMAGARPSRRVISQRCPHAEVELAPVAVEGARLVLVVAVVLQHRVVEIQRVELQRQSVAQLVAHGRGQVAVAGGELRGRAIQAHQVVRAVRVGEARAEHVVLVVRLDVVGVLRRPHDGLPVLV